MNLSFITRTADIRSLQKITCLSSPWNTSEQQKSLNSATSLKNKKGLGQFNCFYVTCKVAGSLPFLLSPAGICAFTLAIFFWENIRKPPSLCTEFWCLACHFLMALNCWLAWWDSILAKASSRWFAFWITYKKVTFMITFLSILVVAAQAEQTE